MKDCVSCVHEYLSPMSDTCRECGIAMLNYKEAKPKPITNYDRLRAKSAEEMAEKIGESIDCEVCKTMHHSESGECPCRPHQSCFDFWLDRLKQEAQNEQNAD